MHEYHPRVARVLRQTTTEIILPRYRALSADDVEEKAPGEIVTTVDRAMEAALGVALNELAPHARFVGEEACEGNPRILEGLDHGDVWIVDPLDGTSNFAAGHGQFGVIVAYASRGTVQAAWLYDPLADRMCHAARGGGAFVDEERIRTVAMESTRPVAALATQFLPAEMRQSLIARVEAQFDLVPIPRCAAEHYPRLALGQNQIALFQRTLPWDHAAGALFLTEAGGHVARWDGTPYIFHDGRRGILAASTPSGWHSAHATLFADDCEFHEHVELFPQSPVVAFTNNNILAKD